MNEFKDLFENKIDSAEHISQAKDLLQRAYTYNWAKCYWAAKYLYEYDLTGESDKLIIEGLECALSNGLNIRSNNALFIDASKILARVYYKYKAYRKAENSLLHIRELATDAKPDWVFLYSAAILHKNDIMSVVANPALLFSYFDEVSSEDPEIHKQKTDILKDFLNNTVFNIINNTNAFSPANINLLALHKMISPFLIDLENEWNEFMTALKEMQLNIKWSYSNLPESVHPLIFLLEHQDITIRKLKEEVTDSNNEIERLLGLLESQEADAVELPKQEANPVHNEHVVIGRKPKILIFGSTTISVKQMEGIAASEFGLEKDQLVFMLDYEQNKKFRFDDLRYSSPYGGILIGPNAHKMAGVGDYSSIIQRLKNESGFPHVEEIRTNVGELKITKSSYKDALRRMVAHIDSLGIN